MAYWLKPFGTGDPRRYMDPDWIHEEEHVFDPDRWEILSGPSADTPPPMGTADKLIFHSLRWSTIFGAGEILAPPTLHDHPYWKKQLPWVCPVRVDVWIPIAADAPRTSEFASSRREIQAGGSTELTAEEHATLLRALLASPIAQTRPRGIDPQDDRDDGLSLM